MVHKQLKEGMCTPADMMIAKSDLIIDTPCQGDLKMLAGKQGSKDAVCVQSNCNLGALPG